MIIVVACPHIFDVPYIIILFITTIASPSTVYIPSEQSRLCERNEHSVIFKRKMENALQIFASLGRHSSLTKSVNNCQLLKLAILIRKGVQISADFSQHALPPRLFFFTLAAYQFETFFLSFPLYFFSASKLRYVHHDTFKTEDATAAATTTNAYTASVTRLTGAVAFHVNSFHGD